MRLKELRLRLGLVQADIAKALNISVQSYCNYEKGQRQPTPDMLSALADYFGVSVDYLLNRKTPEATESPSASSGLTEGERALLDLFSRVPADKQNLVVQMIRAALESQQ